MIRGGTVFDGSGGAGRAVDVAVVDGRIATVGVLSREPARTVLDAGGCFVTPGFIDMHSHVEDAILRGESLEPKLRQGVTLEVTGQDGVGLAPAPEASKELIADTYATWSGAPSVLDWGWSSVASLLGEMDHAETNVAFLVPHGNLRMATAGLEDRRVRPEELVSMQRLLAEALDEGAVGLSTGLTYLPCMFADTDELIELCRVVAAARRYFSPHHRGYGVGAMDSYLECEEIGRASGVPVHLTHAVLEYDANRGRAHEILEIVDRAAAAGHAITLDTYPYTAGLSHLGSFLPGWAQEGGHDALISRLHDPSLLEAIKADMLAGNIPQHTPIDWAAMVVSSVKEGVHTPWVGSSIQQIATSTARDPFKCFVELLVENDLAVQVIEFAQDEDNLRTIVRHPRHMVGSDGSLRGSRPHPRAWGTFARFLGRYVRDLGLVTWEEAIRKITSLPAATIGVHDRGRIAPGMHADIAVFEPNAVIDTATYEEPRSLAVGMRHVIVNGIPGIEDERYERRTSGQAVRGSAQPR